MPLLCLIGSVTAEQLTAARDYLITCLSLRTWQRAGVIANIKVDDLKSAVRTDDGSFFTMLIKKHKTSSVVRNTAAWLKLCLEIKPARRKLLT